MHSQNNTYIINIYRDKILMGINAFHIYANSANPCFEISLMIIWWRKEIFFFFRELVFLLPFLNFSQLLHFFQHCVSEWTQTMQFFYLLNCIKRDIPCFFPWGLQLEGVVHTSSFVVKCGSLGTEDWWHKNFLLLCTQVKLLTSFKCRSKAFSLSIGRFTIWPEWLSQNLKFDVWGLLIFLVFLSFGLACTKQFAFMIPIKILEKSYS